VTDSASEQDTQQALKPCILLAAGGTGGHLFPAFALAEELGRRRFVVDLATDMRGDRYGTGFPARAVHAIPSATLNKKSIFTVARSGWTIMRGIWRAYWLAGRIKPVVVVGFGGYPSFPPVIAAGQRRIPSVVHEQNAVLGRANRILAQHVTAIATSFQDVKFLEGEAAAKARYTGNPVRAMVIEAAEKPYAPPSGDGPFRLLVFGGSQGAKYFSDAVPPALAGLPDELRQRLHVTQQCRAEDLSRVQARYAEAGIDAECAAFFDDLPFRIADSHLVIGRAGASSVAELTVIGRPSILVPLPHALDNDQLQNATSLATAGGGWCIQQKDLSPERLQDELAALMEDPGLLVQSAAAARRQGRPDAVMRLADLVEELATGAK